jgi:hypothetical protein
VTTTEQYVNSVDYADDLRAARDAWTTPRIMGGAGMFIFTTVGSASSTDEALMLRKAAGVGRQTRTIC